MRDGQPHGSGNGFQRLPALNELYMSQPDAPVRLSQQDCYSAIAIAAILGHHLQDNVCQRILIGPRNRAVSLLCAAGLAAPAFRQPRAEAGLGTS